MDVYSKDYRIDGWPITKNGEPMSKEETISELNLLRAKLADADRRNNELVEASAKLLNDAKAWKKMSASMGVVESIVAKHKASMEGK